MRKLMLLAAILTALALGYLAGCRSHVPARTLALEPREGQVWRDDGGHVRVIRCVINGRVYWHHPNSRGKDRSCSMATWRAWARGKGAVVE